MSDMRTWELRASQLSDMADRESDRADTAERVIERLHMQLECERDLAERVIDNCTAAWERLVAKRDELEAALTRMAAARDWERAQLATAKVRLEQDGLVITILQAEREELRRNLADSAAQLVDLERRVNDLSNELGMDRCYPPTVVPNITEAERALIEAALEWAELEWVAADTGKRVEEWPLLPQWIRTRDALFDAAEAVGKERK